MPQRSSNGTKVPPFLPRGDFCSRNTDIPQALQKSSTQLLSSFPSSSSEARGLYVYICFYHQVSTSTSGPVKPFQS